MTYKDTVQFRQVQKMFMITLLGVKQSRKYPLLFRQNKEKAKHNQKQAVLPVVMVLSQDF